MFFKTKDIKFYANGLEIIDQHEKKIAYYLTRFGDWQECKNEVVYEDNDVVRLEFLFLPERSNNDEHNEQPFEIIGTLSSMVSAAFSEHTVHDNKVVALNSKHDPKEYSLQIPEDYMGDVLHLWRFKILPNNEFSSSIFIEPLSNKKSGKEAKNGKKREKQQNLLDIRTP